MRSAQPITRRSAQRASVTLYRQGRSRYLRLAKARQELARARGARKNERSAFTLPHEHERQCASRVFIQGAQTESGARAFFLKICRSHRNYLKSIAPDETTAAAAKSVSVAVAFVNQKWRPSDASGQVAGCKVFLCDDARSRSSSRKMSAAARCSRRPPSNARHTRTLFAVADVADGWQSHARRRSRFVGNADANARRIELFAFRISVCAGESKQARARRRCRCRRRRLRDHASGRLRTRNCERLA